MEEIRYHTMTIRTYVFGVRFRSGFRGEMLARQGGMDRYAHNRLLETLRDEYRRTGMVDTSRGRINMWYTDLRNVTGPRWLKQSVSGITRQTLHDLGRHYSQYVETEHARAAGAKPGTEWGEPHYKRHGDRISMPLTITHDNPRQHRRQRALHRRPHHAHTQDGRHQTQQAVPRAKLPAQDGPAVPDA